MVMGRVVGDGDGYRVVYVRVMGRVVCDGDG